MGSVTMKGSELHVASAAVGEWFVSPLSLDVRDVKRQQPCTLRGIGQTLVCLPGLNPPVWQLGEYIGATCDPSNRIWTPRNANETAPPRVYVIENNTIAIFSLGDFVQGAGTSVVLGDCETTYPVKGWRLQNKLPDETFPSLK